MITTGGWTGAMFLKEDRIIFLHKTGRRQGVITGLKGNLPSRQSVNSSDNLPSRQNGNNNDNRHVNLKTVVVEAITVNKGAAMVITEENAETPGDADKNNSL